MQVGGESGAAAPRVAQREAIVAVVPEIPDAPQAEADVEADADQEGEHAYSSIVSSAESSARETTPGEPEERPREQDEHGQAIPGEPEKTVSEAGAHATVPFTVRFGFSPPAWQRTGAQEEADRDQEGEYAYSSFASSIDSSVRRTSSIDSSVLGPRPVEQQADRPREQEVHPGAQADHEDAPPAETVSEAGSHGDVNVPFTVRFGFSPSGWQRPGAQEEADADQEGEYAHSSFTSSSSSDGSIRGSGLGEPGECSPSEQRGRLGTQIEKALEAEKDKKHLEAGELPNVSFIGRFGFSPPGWQRPGAQEEADADPDGQFAYSRSSSSSSLSGESCVLGALPGTQEERPREETERPDEDADELHRRAAKSEGQDAKGASSSQTLSLSFLAEEEERAKGEEPGPLRVHLGTVENIAPMISESAQGPLRFRLGTANANFEPPQEKEEEEDEKEEKEVQKKDEDKAKAKEEEEQGEDKLYSSDGSMRVEISSGSGSPGMHPDTTIFEAVSDDDGPEENCTYENVSDDGAGAQAKERRAPAVTFGGETSQELRGFGSSVGKKSAHSVSFGAERELLGTEHIHWEVVDHERAAGDGLEIGNVLVEEAGVIKHKIAACDDDRLLYVPPSHGTEVCKEQLLFDKMSGEKGQPHGQSESFSTRAPSSFAGSSLGTSSSSFAGTSMSSPGSSWRPDASFGSFGGSDLPQAPDGYSSFATDQKYASFHSRFQGQALDSPSRSFATAESFAGGHPPSARNPLLAPERPTGQFFDVEAAVRAHHEAASARRSAEVTRAPFTWRAACPVFVLALVVGGAVVGVLSSQL